MSKLVPYTPAVLEWAPQVPGHEVPDMVPLRFMCGERAARRRAKVLFIPGLGEGAASVESAIRISEDDYGVAAAGAWLSYAPMPGSTELLNAMARDAPRALARHVGRERPVHLVASSLGSLTVNAAMAEPELFAGIGLMAPYVFAYKHLGRLPFTRRSHAVSRGLALGIRLGIQTPLQLGVEVLRNADVRGVGWGTKAELEALREHRWGAVSHALNPDTCRNVAEGFMGLVAAGHPARIARGRRDKVVKGHELEETLQDAASAANVDPEMVRQLIHEVPGMHAPWCSPQGKLQLRYENWLPQLLSQRVRPAAV